MNLKFKKVSKYTIYIGTMQGLDYRVFGSYNSDYDDYNDYDDTEYNYGRLEWNGWHNSIMAGVRFRVKPGFTLFADISVGTTVTRYSLGLGLRIV